MAGFGLNLEGVVVYSSRMFALGGQVSRWANRVESSFVANAKGAAPKRSGSLAAAISGSVVSSSPHGKDIILSIDGDIAPHWGYVIFGTTGVAPITSDRGPALVGDRLRLPAMTVGATNGFGPIIYRGKVSGQRRNNFLRTAHNRTARTHSSIRGMSWSDLGTGI